MSQTQHTPKENAVRFLKQAAKEAREAQESLESHVQTARKFGASWAEIGAILGVSKQAAQQKHSKPQARNTAQDHLYTAADNREADAALATLQAVAARQDAAAALQQDDAQTPTTPSIFLEPAAPAKPRRDTIEELQATVGRAVSKARPVFELPGEVPATAQPGTGKGPHQCPNCGDTNHHGPQRGTVAMYPNCEPTKYDPPAQTSFLLDRTLKPGAHERYVAARSPKATR